MQSAGADTQSAGADTQSAGASMAGIASSTFYVGSAGAMFCWHTEDLDLNSVNHLLHGASKVWWVVPPGYSTLFEEVVARLLENEEGQTTCKSNADNDSATCNSTFLRHKTTLITRERLLEEGVPVLQMEQPCGYMAVTAPGAYHAGLNTGYNIAESVNFCSPRWVDYGMASKPCKCGLQWDWTSPGWAEWSYALGQRQQAADSRGKRETR
jgi:jumonji domain-containing protein 2